MSDLPDRLRQYAKDWRDRAACEKVCIEAADRIEELEKQGALIEELQAKVTCMCGDSVDHSPWAGHSPVSMFDYAVEQEVERRLAALTAGQRP